MLVKGELKCLHCGFISGEWVGVNGAPLTVAGVSAAQRAAEREPSTVVRCGRCAGPVFLEDVSMVVSTHRIRRIRRMRAQLAALDGKPGQAA